MDEDGNPLQHPCLKNVIDREAWWASIHGAAEPDTTEYARDWQEWLEEGLGWP